jgi:DNA-binding FrmR family transcriptional regulator
MKNPMQSKEKILTALKKARTSLEKIITTIEENEPDCFAVVQQNLAVIGLLKSANLLMLENHMERTVGKGTGSQTKHMKSLQQELLKIIQVAQNK